MLQFPLAKRIAALGVLSCSLLTYCLAYPGSIGNAQDETTPAPRRKTERNSSGSDSPRITTVEVRASLSKEYLDRAKDLPLSTLDFLASDAISTDKQNGSVYIDSFLYRAADHKNPPNLTREGFYEDIAGFKQLNAEMQQQFDFYQGAKPGIDRLADLGGPIGVFAGFMMENHLDTFMNGLHRQLLDAEREEAQAYFGTRMLDVKALREARDSGSPSFFVKEIERQAGFPRKIEDLPEEAREAATIRLGEFALATIAVTGTDFSKVQATNNSNFKDLDARVKKVTDAQDIVTRQMAKLMTETEDNTKGLNAISEELDRQHADLSLIQRVMYSHLTVDEQIDLVQHSEALNLAAEKKAELITNLKERKTILEDARVCNELINGGQQALVAMQRLGVDPKVVAGMSDALKYGSGAFNAVSSALTGNYFGAAMAVLGMFGGGGGDPETAHFQAIMAKLDEIVQTQRQIIETQKLILQELQKIENLIVQNQIELRSDFDSVYALQILTLEAVRSGEKSNLNFCDNFHDGAIRQRTYDSMQKYFAPRSDTYRSCASYLERSIGTLSGDRSRFAVFFGLPLLELANQPKDPHSVQTKTPVRDLIAPFFAYLDNYADEEDRDKKTVKGSFFYPTVDYPSLKQKEAYLSAANAKPVDSKSNQPSRDRDGRQVSQSFRTLRPLTMLDDSGHAQWYYDLFNLDDFLSPEDVAEYAKTEVKINDYRDLVAPGSNKLFDRSELIGGQYAFTGLDPGRQALQVAFSWLSEAIAQQSLISGDSLLQFLNRDGFRDYDAPDISLDALKVRPAEGEKASDKRAALARYLLGHNYILLENALRYRMYELMAGGNGKDAVSFASYLWAWKNPDPVYMNHLFGDSMGFSPKVQKPKDSPATVDGWSYSYKFWDYPPAGKKERTVTIPLPTPEEVQNREFLINPSLRRLLATRDEINTLLAQYQLSAEANQSPEKLRALKSVLLTRHYSNRLQ